MFLFRGVNRVSRKDARTRRIKLKWPIFSVNLLETKSARNDSLIRNLFGEGIAEMAKPKRKQKTARRARHTKGPKAQPRSRGLVMFEQKDDPKGRFVALCDDDGCQLWVGSLVYIGWTAGPIEVLRQRARRSATFKEFKARVAEGRCDTPPMFMGYLPTQMELPSTRAQARKLQAILAPARIAPNWYRANYEVMEVIAKFRERFWPGAGYSRIPPDYAINYI